MRRASSGGISSFSSPSTVLSVQPSAITIPYSLFPIPYSLFPVPCSLYFIEKSLQDERRGNLVHYPAMLLAGAPGLVENLVSLLRGQPLVAQVNGKAGKLTQFPGESLRLFRLAACRPLKMQRIPHHNTGHAKTASQPGQRA